MPIDGRWRKPMLANMLEGAFILEGEPTCKACLRRIR